MKLQSVRQAYSENENPNSPNRSRLPGWQGSLATDSTNYNLAFFFSVARFQIELLALIQWESALSWIHGFVTCLLFDFSFSLNRLGRRGTPQGRAGRGRVGRYPPPSRVVSPGLKCFMNTLFSLLSLFRKDPPPKWRFSWAIAKMRDLDQNWVQLSRTPQIRSTPPPSPLPWLGEGDRDLCVAGGWKVNDGVVGRGVQRE